MHNIKDWIRLSVNDLLDSVVNEVSVLAPHDCLCQGMNNNDVVFLMLFLDLIA